MELVRSVASLAGLPLPRARDLEALADACDAAPEFARLTRHVVARLRFLSDKFDVRRLARQLAPLARLVELCVDLRQFLRKQRIKTLVMRVATARVVVEDVQALHRAIDAISTELRLEQRDFRGSEELSPAGWGGKLRDDIEDLLAKLERCTKKARPLIRELSIESVMAGLAVLKYELEHSEDKMSARLRAILFNTFGNIVRYSGVNVPKIPSWFLRLDDGSELEGISVDNCYISEIDKPSRPGKWSPHMRAVIRNIEVDPAEFERNEFIKATELWLTLNHKHVVKLCGGNHLKSMTFVAYEDAITDSFVTYFAHDRDTTGDTSDSKSVDASRLARFWQLFTEIAEGIQYLHDKGIKHGDLRCSNFVISADGTAKVCDFVDRASKKADYRRQQTVRWKAPECIVDNGPDPSCEGDIFALGLSLLEAWIGEPPFGTASDDEIFELYRGAEDGIQRPDDVPDSIWGAVERLCKFNLLDRPNIAEVVGIFRECFVDAQARVEVLQEQKLS